MERKNILIMGSTGMIGGLLLERCLSAPGNDFVTTIVRNPSGKSHPRFEEIIMTNFRSYDLLPDVLLKTDIVFYCLGVYTGSVRPMEFRKITVDYPVSLAKELVAHRPDITFCFLSGSGADRTEKSRIMFARDKGAAENQIEALGFKAFYAFRPGYIYPVVRRKEPNLSYYVMRALYPIIRLFGKRYSITSHELVEAMYKAAMEGAPQSILENADIRKLVGR